MRTTIAIDEALVAELLSVEPGLSRSAAMRKAVETHVRQKSHEAFMSLAGSKLVSLGWRNAEGKELRKLRKHGQSR